MTVFANATLGTSNILDICIGSSLILAMTTSLIMNPLVIFYHFKKRSSEARLLLTLLGVSDFLTLFLIPLINIESFLSPAPDTISDDNIWYKLLSTWSTEITIQYSAFLTAVLSLTRYISIAYPFYLINMPALRVAVILWFLYLLGFRIISKVIESLKYGCDSVWDPFAQLIVPHIKCPKVSDPSYKLMYVVNATVLQRGIWIIISLFSLTFTVTKLHRRQTKSARRGEVTVVILTTAYLLAFVPMVIENVFWISNSHALSDNGYYLFYVMVTYPGQILSAINPIIIITRSSDFQRFIKDNIFSMFAARNSKLPLHSGYNLSPIPSHVSRRLTPASPNVRRPFPVPLRRMHSYPPVERRFFLCPTSSLESSIRSFSDLFGPPSVPVPNKELTTLTMCVKSPEVEDTDISMGAPPDCVVEVKQL